MSSSEYTEILQVIGIVYAIWLTYVTIWKDSNKNDDSMGFIGKCFMSIAALSVGFSVVLVYGAMLPLMIILFVGFYILNFFKG